MKNLYLLKKSKMIRSGLLFTDNGLLRVDEIGSVFAPNNVLLRKDVSIFGYPLEGFEQHGVNDVICLTTNDGVEICVTEESHLLIEGKEEPEIRNVKNVNIGDRLIVATDKCCVAKENRFVSVEFKMDKIESLELSEDLIILLANYCYSGTMFGSRVNFRTSQKHRGNVIRALERLNVNEILDFNNEISFTNELFCQWAVANKINDVPYIIRTATKKTIKTFLSGLEQTFPSIHSSSSAFVQQSLALYRYVGYLMRFDGKFVVRGNDSGNFDSDVIISKTRFSDYTFFTLIESDFVLLSGVTFAI